MSTLSERIIKFNQGLLPEMVQLKYKLMSESPFDFFRGTCHLFYEDLSEVKDFPLSPSTWTCGDLHVENFGSFKGDNRMVYFDLNDFDESILAPLCWEVVRTLTSIFVAFSALEIKGAEAKKAAKQYLENYSEIIGGGKAYYIDPRTARGMVKHFMKAVKKRKEEALIEQLCDGKAPDGKIGIDNKTYFKVAKDIRSQLKLRVAKWIKDDPAWPNNYVVKDVVFRVAGLGSVGLKRYMFLLQSTKDKKKFIIVEMKQARSSALTPYISIKQPDWKSEVDRVISIERRMQNIPPALLSEIDFQGETYVFQEMQPSQDKIKFELIEENYGDLENVIKDMALLAASSQIRSSGMQGSAVIDELTSFAQAGDWQETLLKYAMDYSKQVSKDFNQFLSDYKKGEFLASPIEI